MFQLTEKLIGRRQTSVFGAGEVAFILQSRERQHGAAVTHPGIGAAVEPLQALHQELDVADAPSRQLHVNGVGGLQFFLAVIAR